MNCNDLHGRLPWYGLECAGLAGLFLTADALTGAGVLALLRAGDTPLRITGDAGRYREPQNMHAFQAHTNNVQSKGHTYTNASACL